MSEIRVQEQLTLHEVLAGYDFPDVEKMAAIFNLSKTPLAIGSTETNTLDLVNTAFAELHGYAVGELRGKPIHHLFAPEMRDQAIEDINRANELGYWIYESKHAKKDGTLIQVQIEATAVRDKKRNLLFRIFTLQDISERKQAEEKIHAIMEELKRSNQDLESFSVILAHDLKSPLLAVSGSAQHLLKSYSRFLDETGRDYLTMILESSERMLRLIRELREYAKSGAGPKELKEVNMEKVIRQAIENLRTYIEAYEVSIKVDMMPVIKGDEVQLIQLAQNLISNSINYRKVDEPLSMSISCERRSAQWVFRFKDNGVGIERSLFEKIFFMFQRGTDEKHEGMGLGLSICKRIVERHGGRIWVDAVPGKGATFYFSIPTRD